MRRLWRLTVPIADGNKSSRGRWATGAGLFPHADGGSRRISMGVNQQTLQY